MTEISAKSRADLGWDQVLEHLAQRCHTDRGTALVRSLLPLATIDDAHARQAEVAEARGLHDSGEPMGFGGIRDLTVSLGRAEKGGVLSAAELCDVARTLNQSSRLRRHLAQRKERAPRLLERAAQMAELPEVAGPIDDAFDDGGLLRDSASPALRGLRRKALDLQAELSHRTEALLDLGHIAPYLQDRFVTQREERYVVPVRADARARVKGIVHGQSASGATVFVEPEEIIDLNNRLKLAQLEVADEERRILLGLSQGVQAAADRIAQNLEVLAQLDLLDAAARLSADLRAGPVQLVPPGQGGVDLRNARHPLLLLGGVQVVQNDIRVPPGGTLIVSGPNAGGKTVALKLTGLCALMARAGLHCPVQEGSSLPFFEVVLTDIGDDQSLERSLSTFSAHVLNLCQFLLRAAPDTLILLDEVAGGTDPDQGAALAQAVLEALATAGATVVVTTHYDSLKALAPRDRRFLNASVGYDLERLQPTYRLHLGTPGASGALLVARRLGLPDAIADRARSLLGAHKAGVEELLHELGREREALVLGRIQAETALRRAEHEARQAEELREQVRQELQRARRVAHDDAIAALRQARVQLDEARTALKQGGEAGARPGAEELQQARRRIDELSRDIAAAAPEAPGPQGRPVQGAADLPVGTKVLVPRLNGVGTVISEVARDKVTVQVGALKLNVDIGELRLPSGGGKEARSAQAEPRGPSGQRERRGQQQPAQRPAEAPRAPVRTAATTLDLRGERVDAGLSRTEKFVDDALRAGQSEVFVIHGHGTGQLRNAIRAHFAGFPGVSRLYPAQQEDGGDGVTILELR